MPLNSGTGIGLPNISVVFKEAAASAGIRLSAAKVAIIIVQEGATQSVTEYKSRINGLIMMSGLSQNVIDYINRTFDGCYGRTPSVVYVSVADSAEIALAQLEGYDIDWVCGYLAGTSSGGAMNLLQGGIRDTDDSTDEGGDNTEGGDDTEGETVTSAEVQAAISTWVAAQREAGKYCKAVVANTDDHAEYIINFCTDGIVTATATYSAEDYTSRIAGILACMPLSQSCTYFVLPEAQSVTQESDIDGLIGQGKLVLINDGGAVRIARGVSSATSEGEVKIKLICAKDKIRRELETAIKDGYVGKMACTYDNKCILITAIRNYLDTLSKLGVLSDAEVGIDIDEQTSYLAQAGVDTSVMTVQQIKEANTGDNVFIAISCKLTDAMENFTINITI